MKAAVLGAGGMGGTVISQLQSSEHVSGIIAYDISEEALAGKRKSFEGLETTTDLDSVLSDDVVRLVYVTASNDAHHPLVMRALDADKAVMCEKPIATNLRDAREMVETAEKKGLFFQIGFELRYSRLYTKVKDWIDTGLLGEVNNTHCYYICSEFHRKGSWRNELSSGGGMFGEKLSHYVDLSRWWIGDEVVEVNSVCAPNIIEYYEVRDNYHTTYRFRNGAVSHLTFMMAPAATFKGDPLQNVVTQQQGDGHYLRYLVVGTKGAAEADVFYRTIKRWEFSDSETGLISDWVETLTWETEEDGRHFHNTTDQNLDIARRVAEGLPPATPARDAFETMRLVFAAELSADNARPVRLDELQE